MSQAVGRIADENLDLGVGQRRDIEGGVAADVNDLEIRRQRPQALDGLISHGGIEDQAHDPTIAGAGDPDATYEPATPTAVTGSDPPASTSSSST